VYQRLYSYFGPQRWWPGETPFEVMVGAVLTQNTNWKNVERAIDNLKGRDLLDPHALHRLSEAQLAQLLERPQPEDVAVSQAQVDEAVVALAQAQAQLKDAVLVAPFDGTVLSVQIQAGEWATPGAPAILLAATESLVLAVNVDEVDVAQLAEGQIAYLSFDAIKGEQVTGSVTSIAPSSKEISAGNR